MQKQYPILLPLFIAMLMLTACTLIAPMPETTPTAAAEEETVTETTPTPAAEEEATPEPQAEEAALVGVTWQWVSLADPTGETEVPTPENYTLTFQEDDTVAIKADCNNAAGSYTADDSTLSIVIGPVTLVACPPDSLGDQFLQDLGAAATYFFEDGQLLIDMMADGGTLTFHPEIKDVVTDSADAPAVIEATFVCPDGTNIAAIFDNSANTVTITLPDQTLTLPQTVSASGARYSDGTTTFWNKGNEALVEVSGELVYQNCVTEEDGGG